MDIKRSVFNSLAEQFSDPKISILMGPRQVGKTFLLRALEKKAHVQGLDTQFFDLEQPDDLHALGATESEQLRTLLGKGSVVFVDEFHLVKNLSKVFKAIFDRKAKVKIFASGSSAPEMHKHLKESMAGRVIFNSISPLSWEELHQIPDTGMEDLLRYGGLPGLIRDRNEEKMMEELRSVVSTYITKDVRALIKEENVRAFNHLLYLLAEHQGSLVSTSKIAGEIGLSKPSTERYLEILQQTYVCFPITSYAKNLGNELKKSKKYYFYDLGIRNFLVKDFRKMVDRDDQGILYESFVFLELKKQLKPNMEIRFWRTKAKKEVDFILIKNRIPFPVEVKSKLTSASVPEGIGTFLRHYQNAPGAIVFNNSIQKEVMWEGRKIQFLPHEACSQVDYLKQIV